MSEDTSTKRRRCSTGGSGQPTAFPVKSYASAAGFDISKMSEAEKLDFLIEQVCVTQQLTLKIHNMTTKLDNAYHKIGEMSEEIDYWKYRTTSMELRIVDLEARSRRNNLIFTNIPEPDSETDRECLQRLREFLKDQLKLPSNEGEDFVFQRVHRLGRKRTGVAPNGERWRPRPIIAGFRDFCDRETVLGNAKRLKGTAFGIQQDFPAEIRTARGELWDDYRRARAAQKRAIIAYPAKLVVDGVVERDMFPGWGKWTVGREPPRDEATSTSRTYSIAPRSPMEISMADLVHAREFRPREPATTPPSEPEDQHSDPNVRADGSGEQRDIRSEAEPGDRQPQRPDGPPPVPPRHHRSPGSATGQSVKPSSTTQETHTGLPLPETIHQALNTVNEEDQ